MKRSHLTLVLLFASFLLALPSPAAADVGEGPSLEAYFAGGFGGQYRLRVDGERLQERDLDLDPTLGGGVRVGFGQLFRFGLMAEFRGYGSSDADYSNRDFAFDLSPFIGLRIPVAVSDDAALYLRAIVPLGYTRLSPDGSRFQDESYHGFNTGVLGGLEVAFAHFGLFADVGLRYHRVYARTELGPFDDLRTSLSWAQFNLNTGVVVYF